MGRYIVSNAAATDVRRILAYIRERNPEVVKGVRSKFRTAMRMLADFPGMGHVREDSGDDSLRFWSVYSYLIVYRANTKPLENRAGDSRRS
ncbi:MAG TPA: type II toxin-antitoxin system RelE/ParE family toxin [Tepidisphaeraceae bacterium]|jgi:plasmid stabilization system protein ParE